MGKHALWHMLSRLVSLKKRRRPIARKEEDGPHISYRRH